MSKLEDKRRRPEQSSEMNSWYKRRDNYILDRGRVEDHRYPTNPFSEVNISSSLQYPTTVRSQDDSFLFAYVTATFLPLLCLPTTQDDFHNVSKYTAVMALHDHGLRDALFVCSEIHKSVKTDSYPGKALQYYSQSISHLRERLSVDDHDLWNEESLDTITATVIFLYLADVRMVNFLF